MAVRRPAPLIESPRAWRIRITRGGFTMPRPHKATSRLPMTTACRAVLIGVVALLLGCSRTELLYDNADWLAGRWAGELMDASAEQREAWNRHFRHAMDAHRRERLPEIVALLRSLEAIAVAGPTAAELACWLEAAERVYRRQASWAVPPAAAVLLDSSSQQLDHLAAELARRNREYRDAYLHQDPAEQERMRTERYTGRIEEWTGELSTGQLRLVQAAVRDMPDLAGDWLAYRVQQQERLLALLRSRVDGAELQGFLSDWWVDLADRPAGLLRKAAQARAGWLDLIVALGQTLEPGQRAVAQRRLVDLRTDLEAAADGIAGMQLAWQDLAPCTTVRSEVQ